MAGITKKTVQLYFYCGPLKTVVGYINIKQQETYEKFKIEVDKISDTDIILILLLLLIIIMMIILLLILLLLLLPLITVIIIIIMM